MHKDPRKANNLFRMVPRSLSQQRTGRASSSTADRVDGRERGNEYKNDIGARESAFGRVRVDSFSQKPASQASRVPTLIFIFMANFVRCPGPLFFPGLFLSFLTPFLPFPPFRHPTTHPARRRDPL